MEEKGFIHNNMCVAVMGLGLTGRAAVHYCRGCGARVIVSDNRERERFQAEAAEIIGDGTVEWEAGGHTFQFLSKAELVIVSPGIPYDHEVLVRLKDAGIQVMGELAVVAPLLDIPVIAITGTNGKTTVTSLIGEIVEKAGKRAFVGGNIGTPVFDYLRHGLQADVMVLEVSSFQLQMAGVFAPDVGVLLNITPDHLDWHGSMEAYAGAKMNLFAHQRLNQVAILCADDSECMSRVNGLIADLQTFGHTDNCSAIINNSVVKTVYDSAEIEYDLSETSLAGTIGVRNAAAAILATQALHIEPAIIKSALGSFQPGPHRLQLAGELHGVNFINDSKATNTGAVIAALSQISGKAILIAGGRDKGEDYSLLQESVQEKARAVIVIGEAAEKISLALTGCVHVLSAATLESAIRSAYNLAEPGDTVLLAPACASFDMFTSYGHRGDSFVAAVKQLIAEETMNVACGGTVR